MALTLTSGNESRTAGAPFIPVDQRDEYLRLRVKELMILNPEMDDLTAAQQAQAEMEEAAQRRQAMEARQAQQAADRQRQQDQRRGVDPDTLPADEYGAVSGRTVRTANMSPEDQEADVAQYQGLVDAEIRDLREGRFHGAAAQARQYEQDYGLPTNPSRTGKTDLDYLREIQQQQGFIRTGSGEMIPVGPAPTPERIASIRGFDEWANETPGTERQAIYDPAGYERFREGARQEIQERARHDEFTYGSGPDTDPDLAPHQRHNRMVRSASEDRQAEAEREVRIARLARAAGVSREQARRMMDSGRAAARPAVAGKPANPLPLTVEERRLESQSLRDMAGTRRDAELAARQQSLRDQRMLLAPGGRGVVNAINQLPDGWREIAILDRLTEGRRGGATPLDVQAQQMANALPVMRSAVAGMMQDMDPAAAADRQMQRQIMLAQMPPEQRTALSIQMGQPMGTGYSSSHVGGRWNFWMNNAGVRTDAMREQNFRMEMEGLGYAPAQIDAWIDQRLAAEPLEAPAQPGDPPSPAGMRFPPPPSIAPP